MGKPAPFQRPSINLGTPDVKREWQWVPVHSLRPNDMVRDLGLLVDITDSPKGVTLTFKSGSELTLEEGEQVFAFTAV